MNDRYVGGAPQFDDHWGDKKPDHKRRRPSQPQKGSGGKAAGCIAAVIVVVLGLYLVFGVVCPRIERSWDEASERVDERRNRRAAYIDSLVIEDGAQWTIKRDWSYVRGRVRNIGTRTIRYFEVRAYFYGSDRATVIDQDYTNSAQDLRPGTAISFEIMHRYTPDMKYYRVFVDEVRVD